MYRYFKLSILCLISFNLCAQLSENGSSINVDLDASQNAYFKFELPKPKSLKPILTCTNHNAQSILMYNNLDLKKPNFKDELNIPIDLSKLLKSKPKTDEKNYRQVLYTVKKGETLYKLAKISNEDIASFKKRNNLNNNNLPVGKQVSFGWLENKVTPIEDKKETVKFIEPNIRLASNKVQVAKPEVIKTKKEEIPVKKEEVKNTNKPVATIKDSTMRKTEFDLAALEEKSKMWTSERGVAFWQPSHRKNKHKFVLHNTAPLNSTILLYNPMLKKSISAKVIGRIPDEAYKNNIDIVLSEGAANSLGALDSRFMVDIKYLK